MRFSLALLQAEGSKHKLGPQSQRQSWEEGPDLLLGVSLNSCSEVPWSAGVAAPRTELSQEPCSALNSPRRAFSQSQALASGATLTS